MEKHNARSEDSTSLAEVYTLIDKLFPFHFIVDDGLNIVQCGRNIQKVESECEQGDFVFKHFDLITPSLKPLYDSFENHKEETFIFSFTKKDIKLKGQIITYPSHKKIIFVGNPIIGDGLSLLKNNLSLNDFAAFDAIPDFLLSRQAQEASIKEVQSLVGKLQDSQTDLIQSNKELKQFASVVSHDLRSPIRTIMSFAQLLEMENKGKLKASSQEYLDFIISGASRMNNLVNDLLEYSKVQQIRARFAPVEIGTIINSIRRDLHHDIQTQQATVEYTNMPTILANATLLKQIFQNLISNAIKFRKEEPPVIKISAEEKELVWEFVVQDNGIGFDMNEKEKIFQIFQRAGSSRSREGSGIGLAICKKAAEKHNGQIWVESELNIGSRFYFTICKHLE